MFLGFLYVAVKAYFTQLGCDAGNLQYGEKTGDNDWNLTATCNADCGCKVNKIFPVCYPPENKLFYSACHAGCTTFDNGTISNCTCLGDPNLQVTLGTCSEGCFSTFVTFLGINAFIKLLDSSGRIGNMLVSYRLGANPIKIHGK